MSVRPGVGGGGVYLVVRQLVLGRGGVQQRGRRGARRLELQRERGRRGRRDGRADVAGQLAAERARAARAARALPHGYTLYSEQTTLSSFTYPSSNVSVESGDNCFEMVLC